MYAHSIQTQIHTHLDIIVITFDNTSNLKTRIMYIKLVEDKIFCDSEGAIKNHANIGAIL